MQGVAGAAEDRAPGRLAVGRRAGLHLAGAAMAVVACALAPYARAEPGRHSAAPLRLAQSDLGHGPRLVVPATLTAKPGGTTALPIRIVAGDASAVASFLRLTGLPPAAAVSPGHAIAVGAWALPLYGLSDLTVTLPVGLSGRWELVVSLVSQDGRQLDEARIALVVEPPGAPATKAQTPPTQSAAQRVAAEKMVARGDQDLQNGNIVGARQFYLRAAEMGSARGALKLGATYDPHELARLQVVGSVPNVAEARKWYLRAQELGAPEARESLAALGDQG